MPRAAQADGANSLATQQRARGIYGSRIYALQARARCRERDIYPSLPSLRFRNALIQDRACIHMDHGRTW